jgi:two-component system cell cycle response regulator
LYRSENRIMGYLLTYYNITEHKNELKRMEQMAAYDELTKIVNRRYFFKSAIAAFDEANANNEPISVIMFDLDNFKEVNDVFGHQAGDYVLETMVKIFKPKILPSDIFGRYGGEEFILFRKNIDAEASFRLANELCRLLASTPFIYEKRRIKTSASFGVVGSQSSIDKSLEAYIRLADNALYVSKSRGKNQVTLG